MIYGLRVLLPRLTSTVVLFIYWHRSPCHRARLHNATFILPGSERGIHKPELALPPDLDTSFLSLALAELFIPFAQVRQGAQRFRARRCDLLECFGKVSEVDGPRIGQWVRGRGIRVVCWSTLSRGLCWRFPWHADPLFNCIEGSRDAQVYRAQMSERHVPGGQNPDARFKSDPEKLSVCLANAFTSTSNANVSSRSRIRRIPGTPTTLGR